MSLAALGFFMGCGSEPRTPPVEDALALVPIPRAEFARMEPRVRDQLQTNQARLDEALAGEHPNPADWSRLLGQQGQLYLAYKLEPAAQACFTNARKLAPEDFRWAYYLGYLFRRAGHPEESRAHYESALALNPGYHPTYLALAELLLEEQRLDEAEPLLNQAREMDPTSAPVRIALGQIASMRNQQAQAIEHLEAARRLAPEATQILYPLGLAYRAQDDRGKARYFLGQSGTVQAKPDDPLLDNLEDLITGAHALNIRGAQAFHQGRLQDALKAYRKAVAAAPDDPKSRTNLAAVLSRLNSLDGAIEQLQEALRLDPEHVEANYNMGTLRARQGRNSEAVLYYQRVLARASNHQEAHFNLANTCLRLRRFDQAATHFGWVVEMAPLNATARYGQALALMRLHQWESAKTLLETGFAALPYDAKLGVTLARLLAACPVDGLRDGPRALKIAQQLVASNRILATVEVHAMALAEVGRFEEAIPLQQECLATARQGGRHDLEVHLAANLARYREWQPARKPLRQLAENDIPAQRP